MTGILELFDSAPKQFQIHGVHDLFALQVAIRLADVANASSYAALVAEHSFDPVACAANSVTRRRVPPGIPLDAVRDVLRSGRGARLPAQEVIACSIRRREASLVVVQGFRILYREPLQFSADEASAIRSVSALVGRVVADHPAASFAIEVCEPRETRRSTLHGIAHEIARAAALPVWTLPFHEMCAALGDPRCVNRAACRKVIAERLSPTLEPSQELGCTFDSVALGLIVQSRILLHDGKVEKGPR